MCSCISNTVHRIVVWQIVIRTSRISRVKRKFQNLHTRESAVPYQLTYTVRNISKVFCDNRFFTQCFSYFPEQIHARSFFPVSVYRRLCPVWNREILIKSTEMIDSYHIVQAEHICQTRYPPLISCFFMISPAVEWISP